MTLTKTAALKTASKAVSIHGRRTNWIIIHPYNEIDGPWTEATANSYQAARAKASRIKASLALRLMDKLTDSASCAIYDEMDVRDTRSLVEIGLRASEGQA